MSRRHKGSIRRISVLGSGKVSEKDPVYQQALRLGVALAGEGLTVYHGGYRGVMEAVAKGCRSANGRSIAVTIQGSSSRANAFSDAEIKMPSWKDRLFKLIEKGDAYVFLDGATGTLNELFVVIEMSNRGLLRKPVIVLGKKLGAFLRSLKKDPHFDLPRECCRISSIPQVIKILKRSK